MKQIAYAIVTLAIIAAGGLAVALQIIELKDVVIGVLPVVSTFLGATLAFRLTEDREQRNEALRRKQALDFALFILLQQDNAVRQIAAPYIAATSEFERAFMIPALKPPDYAGLRQDLTSLAFLIEVEQPQILFELAIEQERFSQAIEALRIRNEFYVAELQPALERNALIGRQVSFAEAERLLGVRVFGAAMNQARFVHQHLLASKDSIPSIFSKLRVAANRQFPNAKFLAYAE